MSYLHVPRVSIYGEFEAGGVTANNVLAAREEVNTSKFDLAKNHWHYNNLASNQFWVRDKTRVVMAWDSDGPVASDLVLGAVFGGDGVMADLDPEHRRATDLIGFQLVITRAPAQEPLLTGTLKPTQLRDYWVTNDTVEGNKYGVSTIWQSVLTELRWSADVSKSKVLSRLQSLSGSKLSARLTMTLYNLPPDPPVGKLLAVIGPYSDGEPEQLVPGRRLTSPYDPKADYPGFPVASFLVDEQRHKLVVDLCNLVPRTLNKPTPFLLAGLKAQAGGQALGNPRKLSTDDWANSGGLVEWDLTAQEQTLLEKNPLRLDFTQDPDGTPKNFVLNENAQGKYVDTDRRSLRLNPGDTATVAVYARQFGKPLPGERLTFLLKRQTALDPINGLVDPQSAYYPKPPEAPINSDPDVFKSSPPFTVTTDANGQASLSVDLKPGPYNFPKERQSVDSQLYFLGDPDGWQRWGALGPEVGAHCALSILVFNKKDVPESPVWKDVSRILTTYARLYPIMKQVIDLSDENAVKSNAYRIRERLKADVDTVQYMPITRDLSASDRKLLVRYLDSIIRAHRGLPSP
jgi:hypothetical protein